MPSRHRQALVEPADDADELALDPDVVVELRRVVRVRGLEADAVLLRKNRFSVTAFSSTWATTMSPLRAVVWGRISTKSPSAMCSSIIESPRTRSTYASPLGASMSGTAIVSEASWYASIGPPAAISPIDRQHVRLGGDDWGTSSCVRPELGSPRWA